MVRSERDEGTFEVRDKFKRKIEVIDLDSDDGNEVQKEGEEVVLVMAGSKKKVEVISLGSEDGSEEAEAEAKPILSYPSEIIEEEQEYDGDKRWIGEKVEGEHGEDEYPYDEESDLEVTSQDLRSPAVVKWLEGVRRTDGEVIDISSGERISASTQDPLERPLTFNLDDSDTDSIHPHSTRNMSSATSRQPGPIRAATLLRAFQGEKSVLLRNGEPFVSTSTQQGGSTEEFKILDFSSPSPPPSPGIRPCNTILSGFGYSQPVLDFTDDLPHSVINHRTLTGHLVLGEDQRGRSVSRSLGRVDHSPSPSTASSSDNASSHLDRFSGSESEHDESRYQTLPSHQQNKLPPPPVARKQCAPRRFRVNSQYGVASDQRLENSIRGEPHEAPPLNVVLKLDMRLLQRLPFQAQAGETRTEEIPERLADKHTPAINLGPLPGLGNNMLQSRNPGKRPVVTSTQEAQESVVQKVARPDAMELSPGLGNSIFIDRVQAPQKQFRVLKATSDDRDVNRQEQDAGFAQNNQVASPKGAYIGKARPDVTNFAPIEDDTSLQGEEVEREQNFHESIGGLHDRPKVFSVTQIAANFSNMSSRARLSCEEGCFETFGRTDERNQHHRHVHKSGMFKCKTRGCNQEFFWREELKTHKATHDPSVASHPKSVFSPPSATTDESTVLACSDCANLFASKETLQRHIVDCHEKSQAGQSEPGASVKDPRVQEQPQQKLEERIPAPGCSREGPTPTLTKGDVWTCVFPDCGARRGKRWNLEQHYRLGHDVRLYRCNNAECEEKFTHQNRQKEHSLTCRSTGGRAFEAVNSQPQTNKPSEPVKLSREMPGLLNPNVLRPISGFDIYGGSGAALWNGAEPAQSGVSISGEKRKRMNDDSGSKIESGMKGDDDYDSDEELKYPSIKRKRLMSKRAM